MNRVAQFGDFELDFQARTLKKFGTRLPVQHQPLEILICLLERPGEVVTRRELSERLWPPNVFVDHEHNLNRAVNKLRAVLSDSPEEHRFIETISGHGYRFDAPITWISGGERVSSSEAQELKSPTVAEDRRRIPFTGLLISGGITILVFLAIYNAPRARTSETTVATPRVAVLPVTNLTGDAKLDVVASTITQEIADEIKLLANENIVVVTEIPWQDYGAARVSEIAKTLKADYVVRCTIQSAGKGYLIFGQLVRAADDTNLWKANFNRQGVDPVRLSTEVSLPIADEVVRTIEGRSSSRRESYIETPDFDNLKGHYFWNRRTKNDLETSIFYFNRAIESDPANAVAYAALANAYSAMAGKYLSSSKAYALARQAAEKSLAVDPECAEAHAALGHIKFAYDVDWAGAEAEFRRALELNPADATTHYWYAIYLATVKRFRAATAHIDEALNLEPLSVPINQEKGMIMVQSGELDGGIRQLKDAIELDPASDAGYAYLGIAAERRGNYDEAVLMFSAAQQRSDIPIYYAGAIAHAEALQGNRSAAEQSLNQILSDRSGQEEGDSTCSIAQTYLALGEKEKAVKWLERAIRDRSCSVPEFNTDPSFDSLRSDPRIQKLLASMNLPN
jgi:DNA-binding winged helix-turn-helix (wHTH) protein/tetratricopeptide (TPR) repeat protein